MAKFWPRDFEIWPRHLKNLGRGQKFWPRQNHEMIVPLLRVIQYKLSE